MWSKYAELTAAQTKILKIDVTISMVINSAFNMFFSWKIAHGLEQISLFGQPGIAVDLALTTFMIILMTTFFGGSQMMKMLNSGKVTAVTAEKINLKWLGRLFDSLPRYPILRGLLLGLCITLFLGPILSLILMTLNIDVLPPQTFYILKFIYGVTLAFFITPLIALSFMYKNINTHI